MKWYKLAAEEMDMEIDLDTGMDDMSEMDGAPHEERPDPATKDIEPTNLADMKKQLVNMFRNFVPPDQLKAMIPYIQSKPDAFWQWALATDQAANNPGFVQKMLQYFRRNNIMPMER